MFSFKYFSGTWEIKCLNNQKIRNLSDIQCTATPCQKDQPITRPLFIEYTRTLTYIHICTTYIHTLHIRKWLEFSILDSEWSNILRTLYSNEPHSSAPILFSSLKSLQPITVLHFNLGWEDDSSPIICVVFELAKQAAASSFNSIQQQKYCLCCASPVMVLMNVYSLLPAELKDSWKLKSISTDIVALQEAL